MTASLTNAHEIGSCFQSRLVQVESEDQHWPCSGQRAFCGSRTSVFSDSWQPAKMWRNKSDWSTRLASIENQDSLVVLLIRLDWFHCTGRGFVQSLPEFCLDLSKRFFLVGSFPDGYTAMLANQTHGGKSPVLSAAVCSHTLIQVCCFQSADCFSLSLLFSIFFPSFSPSRIFRRYDLMLHTLFL